MMLSSYPSIYALGHRALKDLFLNPVAVQEKVDGSQVSFGVFKGELYIRSKGSQIHVEKPDSMFSKGVAEIVKRQHDLIEGWIYRGEYLSKPKHNVLAYNRVPKDHIILFDVETGLQTFLPYREMCDEARRLGFEAVPLLFEGAWAADVNAFKGMLDAESCLGGPKIEGVVVKNYERFGEDKKVLMGKYVSEAFKEVHAKLWGESPKGKGDIIQRFVTTLKTEARWMKAVQHLRDQGLLTDSPKDIGLLIHEIKRDVETDAKDWMLEQMFKEFVPQVLRGVTGGAAEWYKDYLLKQQFSQEPVEVPVEGQDGKE